MILFARSLSSLIEKIVLAEPTVVLRKRSMRQHLLCQIPTWPFRVPRIFRIPWLENLLLWLSQQFPYARGVRKPFCYRSTSLKLNSTLSDSIWVSCSAWCTVARNFLLSDRSRNILEGTSKCGKRCQKQRGFVRNSLLRAKRRDFVDIRSAPVSEPNKALYSRWCLHPRTVFEKTVLSMRCSLISLGNVRHWVGVVIGNVWKERSVVLFLRPHQEIWSRTDAWFPNNRPQYMFLRI